MPAFHFLFGCQVKGFEKLQDGPYLFISNHNIGSGIEIFALLDSWKKNQNKPIYGLAHRIVFKSPPIRHFMQKIGAIPATFDAAVDTLNQGNSLIIFPGGAEEGLRPFTERHLCDLGQHKGFASIAVASKVSVVPISISGNHMVNPVLIRSKLLARILIVPRMVGLTVFPITLGQIFFSAAAFTIFYSHVPLWVTILAVLFIFFHTPLVPIFPARIKIKVGNPLDPLELGQDERYGANSIDRIYNRIQDEIQKGMDDLRLGIDCPQKAP